MGNMVKTTREELAGMFLDSLNESVQLHNQKARQRAEELREHPCIAMILCDMLNRFPKKKVNGGLFDDLEKVAIHEIDPVYDIVGVTEHRFLFLDQSKLGVRIKNITRNKKDEMIFDVAEICFWPPK